MSGYEFTRLDVDYTARLKAEKYDLSKVARKAMESLRYHYEVEDDYQDAKCWFLETTMSCDREEVIGWMKFYMLNAIAYGIQTKNLDWRTKFLAAYDIYKSL